MDRWIVPGEGREQAGFLKKTEFDCYEKEAYYVDWTLNEFPSGDGFAMGHLGLVFIMYYFEQMTSFRLGLADKTSTTT